ncbi:MAG: substrate-binding domain-containing protein [Flavobacteriales bacterium]|nr:substrate-binding domain-containing protein [Flavobacteriales bacterium]
MNRSITFLLTTTLLSLALCSGCDGTPRDPRIDDTPTYGRAVVLADEAFKLMLDDHQLVFNSTYPDAQVDIHYMPEAELTRAMLADSVRLVFGAFRPGADQAAYFKTRNLSVHSEPVATDAIAVIVAPESELRTASLTELRNLLSDTSSVGYHAIFDRNGSGVPRTLVDSLFDGDAGMLRRASATEGVEQLVARVAQDPGTVGFVAFAELSDLDDPACVALRERIRIIPISQEPTGAAYLPTQGTLKDGSYPLRRKVIMLVTEGKSGLGTGFASFVAGHKGQRIILKQGLAPERVPARDVEIVHP